MHTDPSCTSSVKWVLNQGNVRSTAAVPLLLRTRLTFSGARLALRKVGTLQGQSDRLENA